MNDENTEEVKQAAEQFASLFNWDWQEKQPDSILLSGLVLCLRYPKILSLSQVLSQDYHHFTCMVNNRITNTESIFEVLNHPAVSQKTKNTIAQFIKQRDGEY